MVTTYNDNGRILALGAKVRRRDPREDRYGIVYHPDAGSIPTTDLGVAHSLVWADANGNVWEPRPAIKDQGGKGACASFAACACAEISCWYGIGTVPLVLSGSELYERVRKLENGANWQQDTGSTLADNLDLAMAGLYSEAEAPESDDLRYNYDAITAGKPTYDYVLSHQPFYPAGDGGADPNWFLKAIAFSLDQGLPVDLGSDWTNAWFTPDANGIVPLSGDMRVVGGHSYYAWGVFPAFGGVVACANQWTSAWNSQVAGKVPHARPGDFLIPFKAFQGKQPLVWEARAVSAQPAQVAPVPPTPPSCRDSALAAAKPVVDRYQTDLTQAPRSVAARYHLQGAQAVVAALGKLAS